MGQRLRVSDAAVAPGAWREQTPGAGGAGRYHASQAPPTELGPAHHEEACQSLPTRAQFPVPVPGSGVSRGRRGPGPQT